jgi:hypothetical protein
MPVPGQHDSRKLQRLLNARWWELSPGDMLEVASGTRRGEPFEVRSGGKAVGVDDPGIGQGDLLAVKSTSPLVMERAAPAKTGRDQLTYVEASGEWEARAPAYLDACHPDYGASPSASGAENRDAIQAALDDSANRPVTLSQPGTYDVAKRSSDPWCLTLEGGSALDGLSKQKTALRLESGTDDGCHVLNLTGDAVRVSNLSIDGNKAGQAGGNGGHGIRDSLGGERHVLRSLRVIDCRHYGIGLQDRSNKNRECILYDLTLENNDSDGIDVKGIEDSIASQILARNNGNKGIDVRAWGMTFGDLVAEGNSNAGIAMRGNTTDGTTNYVLPNRNSAASLFSQGNGGAGIVVDVGHADNEGEFGLSGAVARGNGGNGIVIRGSVMYVSAAALTAKDNDASGILATCDRLALTGCVMFGNVDWGFDNNGEDHNHCVTGNVAQGNATGQIQAAGASALHTSNLT